MKREDVTIRWGTLELDLHLLLDFTPRNAAEATDQGIEAAVLQLVNAPEVGQSEARLPVPKAIRRLSRRSRSR